MDPLSICMFILPSFFSLIIHIYLRHGDVSAKRKIIHFFIYFVIINAITFLVSYARGIKSLNFDDMTSTYKLKYLGLGGCLGFIMPFFVCLLTEDIITVDGFIRYITRFFRDLKKYFPYAVYSAKSDLKAEVASSYLNWMWWLIEPFCMMIIYTVIFGMVFRASEQFFPVFIFIGITLWGFFSRCVNSSVGIVRNSKEIITKVYMPKWILLLSKMFVNGFKMMVSFGVILGMMVVFRVKVSINILYLPVILLTLFLFTFGVSAILMHYGVYVNDLGYITGIVLQMLMYITGTFYSVSKRMPQPFGEILEKFNPVACVIASARSSLLYGESVPLWLLVVWSFISIILIALGVFTVYSNENSYVKVI